MAEGSSTDSLPMQHGIGGDNMFKYLFFDTARLHKVKSVHICLIV